MRAFPFIRPAAGKQPGPSGDDPIAASPSQAPHGWRLRPIPVLTVCGLLLTVTIAVGTWAILSDLRNRAIAAAERELRNIVLVLAERTDRAFQAIELVQSGLAEHINETAVSSGGDPMGALSTYTTHLMLKDKISQLPFMSAVTLIDAEGKLINFSRRWPVPHIDVSDRSYFVALKSDSKLTSFLSEPVLNRANGEWTIFLARKVADPNGKFLGVVLGAVELAYLERYFQSIELGQESAVSLFRADGTLLARHPARDIPGTSYAGGPLFQNVLLDRSRVVGRFNSIIDRQERLMAGHRLAHFPVVVGAATTVSAILRDWRSGAIYLTLAAVLMVVVIGGAIVLTARQIVMRQRAQHVRLDAALNNVRQGLQMYDAKGRVILTNEKYLKMYGLSPDDVKRDWTIRDVLYSRRAAGTLAGGSRAVPREDDRPGKGRDQDRAASRRSHDFGHQRPRADWRLGIDARRHHRVDAP